MLPSPEPSASPASTALRRPSVERQRLDDVELLADPVGHVDKALLQGVDVRIALRAGGTFQHAGREIDEADQVGQPLGQRHVARHQAEQGHGRLMRIAARGHRRHRHFRLRLLKRRKQGVVDAGLRADGLAAQLFAACAELQARIDSRVERRKLVVDRRVQAPQPVDGLLVRLQRGDRIEPLCDLLLPGLQRGEFAGAVGLALHSQHGRRAGRKRLGLRLQAERADDLGNVLAGDVVEQRRRPARTTASRRRRR